jgi:hypothetical protein
MSNIILPTEPVKAKYLSPRKLLIYGIPKVGKTTIVSKLPSNLILDLEAGTQMIDALALQVRSVYDIEQVLEAIKTKGMAEHAAGRSPFIYKYITIDTGDALEEMCDESALARYKASKLASEDQKKTLMSITELPHGLGYYYLREEMKRVINLVAFYCERLILITHVKDRLISEKAGATATVKDISLGGKLSSLVCANMDAIGYVYRKPGSDNPWISFESYDANTTMGARCPHLAGKNIELDWSQIYID